MDTSSSRQNALIWLLSLNCFASMAMTRAFDPLLPALADEYSTSLGIASRTVFVYAIAYGVFQLIFGPLGDKFGKLRIISACSLACVVSSLIVYAAPSFDVLVIARLVSGACAAGIFPLSMAWIGDNVDYEARQVALAKLVSTGVLGMLSGQWLSGVVAQWTNWRMPSLLLAFLFLAGGALLLYAALKERKVSEEGAARRLPLFKIIQQPMTPWVLSFALLEGALAYGALAFIPSLMQTKFDFSLSNAGAVAASYALGGFIYTWVARRLLAALGEAGLVSLGGLCLAGGFISFGYIPFAVWSPFACIMAGFGFYCMHNTLQTKATQMAPQARGAAVSLFACILFLGQSVGVFFAAMVADILSISFVFLFAGVGLIILSYGFRTYIKNQAMQ